HLVFSDGLGEIAGCKDFSLKRAYREKTVVRSLTVSDGYGFGWQSAGLKQNDGHQTDRPDRSPHAPDFRIQARRPARHGVQFRTPRESTRPGWMRKSAARYCSILGRS